MSKVNFLRHQILSFPLYYKILDDDVSTVVNGSSDFYSQKQRSYGDQN
jgi:hypothetical protein